MGLDNPLHIAFLLIVLLLVFGAKRLPEVGRSLGSGLRGFKESLSGDAVQRAAPAPPPQPLVAAAPAPELTSAVAQAPAAAATSEAAPASAAGVTPLPAASQPLPPAA